jgi:hypothetical protein
MIYPEINSSIKYLNFSVVDMNDESSMPFLLVRGVGFGINVSQHVTLTEDQLLQNQIVEDRI